MNSLVISYEGGEACTFECHSMHRAAEIVADSYALAVTNNAVITSFKWV